MQNECCEQYIKPITSSLFKQSMYYRETLWENILVISPHERQFAQFKQNPEVF